MARERVVDVYVPVVGVDVGGIFAVMGAVIAFAVAVAVAVCLAFPSSEPSATTTTPTPVPCAPFCLPTQQQVGGEQR